MCQQTKYSSLGESQRELKKREFGVENRASFVAVVVVLITAQGEISEWCI
jgi:hypothetical protein